MHITAHSRLRSLASPSRSLLARPVPVPVAESQPADSFIPQACRCLSRIALVGVGYAGLTACGSMLGLPGVLLAGGAAALGHGIDASRTESASMTVRLAAAGGILGMVAASMGGLAGCSGASLAGVALMGIYASSLMATSKVLEKVLP